MKNKILLLIILVSCQSQANKDREKMQGLINIQNSLENEYASIKLQKENAVESVMYEVDSIYKLKVKNNEFLNADSAAQFEGRLMRIKMDKFLIPLQRISDSIKIINKEIEDLKLLMGK